MTSLTNQEGATTDFEYDRRGLLLTATDPLLAVTTYAYDDAGRLASRKDRKNQTVTYAYTPTGKLDTVTYPDLSTVTFRYNQLDRLVGMKDALTGPSGSAIYAHDAVGRVTSATDSQGFTVGYTYDGAGNVETITYPGDKVVTYTYDQLNRLKTVTDWFLPPHTATYYYDAAGRLDHATNLNGTVTAYGYDNANRLLSLEEKKSGGTIIASYHYTLDPNGNRIREVQDEPQAPPAVPADTTVDYTYNDERNRLTQAGPTGFTYDNEGQLSEKAATSYAFDFEHRLKSIGDPNLEQKFFYDGAGRRLDEPVGTVYLTIDLLSARG